MKSQFKTAIHSLTAGVLLASASTALAAPTNTVPGNSVAASIQGVQHFGITVRNIDRAYQFYTQVLGGTEVMRDGDFQGASIHNTLMQADDLAAASRKLNPQATGVPNLRSGDQRLDVVFIQFDNVVIELLQYRDAEQKAWTEGTFAPAHPFTAPAFPTNMHLSFQVDPGVNFDQFIADFEAAAQARGMDNVRCNRNVDVASEQGRRQAPQSSNALEISAGPSNGWALAYCKGPEGEQLEFNQVKAPVSQLFEAAKTRHQQNKG